MGSGYCVDCNYDGPLASLGDCPRCGSEWTTGSSQLTDEDQLEGLDSMNVGGSNTSTDTMEFAALL